MSAPRLLDLFCSAGGAAMGYQLAGFYVVGVDKAPQPHYCGDEFVQADAFAFGAFGKWNEHVPDEWFEACGSGFAAIHASPPCQFATDYRRRPNHVGEHENLIPETRELLEASGLLYVIENVENARPWLRDPTLLCGSMFDLDVRRHRLFEESWVVDPPTWPCRHEIWTPRFPAATNRAPNSRLTVEVGVRRIPLDVQKRAMGVEWTITREELSQAIPPAYTRFIGGSLFDYIAASAAVVSPVGGALTAVSLTGTPLIGVSLTGSVPGALKTNGEGLGAVGNGGKLTVGMMIGGGMNGSALMISSPLT